MNRSIDLYAFPFLKILPNRNEPSCNNNQKANKDLRTQNLALARY